MNELRHIANDTALSRFSTKYTVLECGCWKWNGKKSGYHGYGGFMLNTQAHQHIGAHVAAFILFNENYDSMLDVAHTCDNPWCVNPAHLVQKTHAENMRESVEKGRHPTIGRKGDRNPAYKLSDEAIREIRASKEASSHIAPKYGIDPSYVRMIRRGATRAAA